MMDGKISITTSLEGLQIKISSKEDLHNLYTIQSLSEVQRLQGSQWKLEPSDWSLPTSGLKPLTLLSAYFSRLSSWSCLLLLFFHLLLSFSCHILYKITQKKLLNLLVLLYLTTVMFSMTETSGKTPIKNVKADLDPVQERLKLISSRQQGASNHTTRTSCCDNAKRSVIQKMSQHRPLAISQEQRGNF